MNRINYIIIYFNYHLNFCYFPNLSKHFSIIFKRNLTNFHLYLLFRNLLLIITNFLNFLKSLNYLKFIRFSNYFNYYYNFTFILDHLLTNFHQIITLNFYLFSQHYLYYLFFKTNYFFY